MKIALIQQHATRDKAANIARGLANLETAARGGAQLACYAELAFEWFHPQRPATRRRARAGRAARRPAGHRLSARRRASWASSSC